MFVMFPLMPRKFCFKESSYDFIVHICIANIVFEDDSFQRISKDPRQKNITQNPKANQQFQCIKIL